MHVFFNEKNPVSILSFSQSSVQHEIIVHHVH